MPNRFTQLGSEFTIVVIGVFAALAAESWWSEREDRRYEREVRKDMLVEFESNVQILEADIAFNEKVREGISSLNGLSDELLLAIPDSVLSSQFGSASFDSAGFDPEMGIVQALVSSGNLGAVEDRDLRLRLSRWGGLIQQCRRKNMVALDFDLSLTPIFISAGSDLHWSEIERRQLQALLDNMLQYFDIRVVCQHDLRAEAQSVLAYLRKTD